MTEHPEAVPGSESAMDRRGLLKRGGALAGALALSSALGSAANARPFITRKRQTVNLWTWAWVTTLPHIKGDPAKAAFEKANPNISLNVKIFSFPDYMTALKTGIPSGTAGDVIAIDSIATGRQYSSYLQPLEPYINKLGSGWAKPFVPGVFDFVRKWDKNGHLLGVPVWSTVGGTMWYSEKVFQKFGIGVPQSYEDIKAFSPALKKAGVAPIAWGAKDGWPNPDFLIVYSSQFKPGVIEAAEEGKASFTDPAIVKALSFMRDSLKDNVYNDDPFSTTAFPDAYINQFGSGKAAMVMGGNWMFNIALPTPGASADWRAFLYPHIPGAPTKSWLQGNSSGSPVGSGPAPSRPWKTVSVSYAMPKKTTGDKAKAAWEFMAFQASRKGQQLNAGWIVPSRTDVSLHNVNPGFVKMLNWHLKVFQYAERRDFLYADVQSALQNAIADVCVNGVDPTQALARVDAVAKSARARA